MGRNDLKKLFDDTDNLANRALDVMETIAKRHANGEYDEDDVKALETLSLMAPSLEMVVREWRRTVALIYPNSE